MTSLEWVYEDGTDGEARLARIGAMTYADRALRGVINPKPEPTEIEREALRIRKRELTWTDVAASKETLQVVQWQVSIGKIAAGVFWGGILLSLADAILYVLLRAVK